MLYNLRGYSAGSDVLVMIWGGGGGLGQGGAAFQKLLTPSDMLSFATDTVVILSLILAAGMSWNTTEMNILALALSSGAS